MITTTLGALDTAQPALGRLAALRLPVKPAYWLAKLCRAAATELENYTALRGKLLEEFGTKRLATAEEQAATRSAEVYDIRPDKLEAFNLEITELRAMQVSLDVPPIDLDALGLADITPADILALMPLLRAEAPVEQAPAPVTEEQPQ